MYAQVYGRNYVYLSLTPSKMDSSMIIISLLLVQLVYCNAGIK